MSRLADNVRIMPASSDNKSSPALTEEMDHIYGALTRRVIGLFINRKPRHGGPSHRYRCIPDKMVSLRQIIVQEHWVQVLRMHSTAHPVTSPFHEI